MKKINGVLCIAIAVAVLVGGVGAVSASTFEASIVQRISESQEIANYNDIWTGDVTADDVSGNNVVQVAMSLNMQRAVKCQCAGIIQNGDGANRMDNWMC